MAYTPTEWKCGDIVTAEKLNAMERGVADMNAEYVPNEWKCGDTITAEKLNHIEQGIADGGGECDFSTAQVTVVNNTESAQGVGLDGGIAGTQEGFAFLIESGGNGVLRTRVGVAPNTTSVFTAVLINASDPEAPSDKLAVYSVFSDNGEITTDGDCMLVDVSGPVIVWGDCTITVNEGR